MPQAIIENRTSRYQPSAEAIEAEAIKMRDDALARAERQRVACGWDEALPIQSMDFFRGMAEAGLIEGSKLKRYADNERRRVANGGKSRRGFVMGQGR